MRHTKQPLTERQNKLHAYIIAKDGAKVSKREIFENVEGYEWLATASDKCPAIRNDMLAINADPSKDEIIVFDHQHYYWAKTPEQVNAFIERKKKTIRTANREIYALRKKRDRHLQGDFIADDVHIAFAIEGESAQ